MRIVQVALHGAVALMLWSGAAFAQSHGQMCQAIYTEARDTESCLAYEAYVLTCEGQPLIPVAQLYLKRKCGDEFQVAAGVTIPFSERIVETAPLHDCDRFAGHPDDPALVGDGIAFDDIHVKTAIDACHHAIGRYSREPRFRFQLGRAYDKAKDYDNAAHGYRTASEMGHIRAKVSIAILFRNGDGVEESPSKAFEWELRAAEAGYVPSMNVVAKAYQKGDDVTRDPEAAFKWHLKSAKNGDVAGMVAVAYFYKEGIGTAQNGSEARRWYGASADKGSGWGRQMLANMLDNGNGGARDPKTASLYLFDALRDCSAVVVDNLTGDYGWFEADTISELQERLRDVGAYTGEIDGRLGPQTTDAIGLLCD